MTLVISHRGLGFGAPEHSIEGYQAALKSGADGIEVDVHLSRDGQLFCIHDASLWRTHGVRSRVSDCTHDQLCEMGIVPLWQVLAMINESAPDKGILIETKHPVVAGSLVEHRLVEDLRFFGFAGKSPNLTRGNPGRLPHEKWAAVMSFSVLAVKRMQTLLPNQVTVFLTNHRWSLSPALRLLGRSTCVGPHISLVKRDASLLSKLSRRSRPIFVWTVNSAEELAACFGQAVSCVITDDARLALQIRDESVLV